MPLGEKEKTGSSLFLKSEGEGGEDKKMRKEVFRIKFKEEKNKALLDYI